MLAPLALLLALLLVVLTPAAPAAAQTSVTLVSNVNQGLAAGRDMAWELAQAFTTGSHANGYKLTKVHVPFYNTSSIAPNTAYTIRILSSNSGNPGSTLATLSFDSATGVTQIWTGSVDLKPTTTYFVYFDVLDTNANGTTRRTISDAEDAGGADGWSLGDNHFQRDVLTNPNAAWASNSASWRIAIRGYAKTSLPPGTTSQRQPVIKRSLAAVAARTTASALDNIGARLGNAVPAAGLTVAGQSVSFGGSGGAFPEDAARSGGSRGVTADELLRTSAFSLALGAAEEGGGLDPREIHLSVWGRGDLGAFAGRPEPGMRYKGETRTGWLGIDARAGRWVAGLAASHGISEADYSFDGGGDPEDRGELETELSALYPYGRWTFENGLELRGLLGRGSGRLRHRPGGDDAPAEASDLTMWMASTGLRRKLPPVAGIDLSARGDVSLTRIKTAHGPTEIGGLTADSRRVRAGVEASRRFEAGSGRSYTPFLEVAARRDGGDGLTGTGLEMAGGLRHSAPGIHVELRGRWLAAYSQKGTQERGLSAIVRMQPKADGRGPSLTLSPRWGAGTAGARALWREEMPKAGANAGAASGGNGAALDARTGYGFGMTPYGVVTPFAETGLSGGGDSRRLRLGTRFDAARMRLGVEVAGERRESVAAEPEHLFRLDAQLRF